MDSNISEDRNLPDFKKHGAIEYRLEVVLNIVEQSVIKGKVECLKFIRKAMQLWKKGYYRDFTPEKRQEIAEILHDASGTLEKGTPLRQQIQHIILLLLSPQFATLINDILELWMHSSNESETLMDNVGLCGGTWREAEGRGRYGSLAVQTAKNLLALLLKVVHILQKEPDMKKNIRLQYVVDFISGLRTELDMQTVRMTNPDSVFRYVKTAMTKYTPPYVPPALTVGRVDEEEEEVETGHDAHHGGAHAPGVGDEAWREGGEEIIQQNADISTLLREMR
jgi:hypothetical protein